ncbi:MAG: hypothetical protein M0R03_23230 [Novosphingobium sp.]|nr:hypothetical protein [Novosphingobium sp.]
MRRYTIYHKSYSSAITEVLEVLAKEKLFMSSEDVFIEISVKSKPRGSTNRVNVPLYTQEGSPALIGVAFQVTDLGNSYELNMYSVPYKKKDYAFDTVEIFNP